MSQQDVAMLADMDRAYISEVENGKRSLSVDRLLRICGVLEIRASTLIARVERERKKPIR
jgi:transcriptional regulator with XRE-family HTH domain